MEKATEMKALESLCLYGKKQLILLLGSIQGIEDHKSSYCGGPWRSMLRNVHLMQKSWEAIEGFE